VDSVTYATGLDPACETSRFNKNEKKENVRNNRKKKLLSVSSTYSMRANSRKFKIIGKLQWSRTGSLSGVAEFSGRVEGDAVLPGERFPTSQHRMPEDSNRQVKLQLCVHVTSTVVLAEGRKERKVSWQKDSKHFPSVFLIFLLNANLLLSLKKTWILLYLHSVYYKFFCLALR
jgi:hypothetical protein